MPGHSPGSDVNDGSDTGGSPPATPRWVKVSAIVAVVLAVLVVVMWLLGHGPAQHSASGVAVGPSSPVGFAASNPGFDDQARR